MQHNTESPRFQLSRKAAVPDFGAGINGFPANVTIS
jgi:hypothetical protein